MLSTLHTLDATETINRIIAVFPPHQQRQVRLQLASVLKAAIAQRLIPRADGLGRAPAVEVMVSTAFIRDCIVDKDKTSMIHGAIAAGTSQYGMQTFDQSIFGLYQQGLVTLDEALRWASNVDEFKLKVQGISTSGETLRVADRSGQPRHHPVRLLTRPAGAAVDDSNAQPDRLLDGLHLLGRRELSVAQLRARLLDREHDPDEVDEAIARLLENGALNDARVAARLCGDRTEGQRPRPPAHSARAAGDGHRPATWSRQALADVFGDLDERSLIRKALEKKLRGKPEVDRLPARICARVPVPRSPGLLAARRHDGAARAVRRPTKGARDHASNDRMTSREIRSSFPQLLRAERPRDRAELARSCRPTTRRCCSPTPG